MRFAGLAILIFILIKSADFIFVPLLIGVFWLKKKFYKMNEKKWDIYFNRLSNGGYAVRFLIIYVLALILACVLGYYLMIFFEFKNALFFVFVTFLLGLLKAVVFLLKNKKVLLEKIRKI